MTIRPLWVLVLPLVVLVVANERPAESAPIPSAPSRRDTPNDKCDPHNQLVCMQLCSDKFVTCAKLCGAPPSDVAGIDKWRACMGACNASSLACTIDCRKGCGDGG